MNDLPSYWSRLMSSDEAESLLAPYYEHFVMAVDEGFGVWTTFAARMPEARRPLTGRARATFINDQIVCRARDLFGEEKGVKMHEAYGFLCLNVGDRAIIHFKKLDEEGRPRSYPTEQQKRLIMQELPMPGCLEPTWLSVGYQLKFPASGDQIEQILVSCCLADKVKSAMHQMDNPESTDGERRRP